MVGIEEDTHCDEHRVSHGSVESLYCTNQTNITLYDTWNKNLKKGLLIISKGVLIIEEFYEIIFHHTKDFNILVVLTLWLF